MRHPDLEKFFFAYALVAGFVYTSALCQQQHLLFIFEVNSPASRLWVGIADLLAFVLLSLFIWWVDYGNDNKPLIRWLPEPYWVFTGAIFMWAIALSGPLNSLLNWARETGTLRFGEMVVGIGLGHLMLNRIGGWYMDRMS